MSEDDFFLATTQFFKMWDTTSGPLSGLPDQKSLNKLVVKLSIMFDGHKQEMICFQSKSLKANHLTCDFTSIHTFSLISYQRMSFCQKK